MKEQFIQFILYQGKCDHHLDLFWGQIKLSRSNHSTSITNAPLMALWSRLVLVMCGHSFPGSAFAHPVWPYLGCFDCRIWKLNQVVSRTSEQPLLLELPTTVCICCSGKPSSDLDLRNCTSGHLMRVMPATWKNRNVKTRSTVDFRGDRPKMGNCLGAS